MMALSYRASISPTINGGGTCVFAVKNSKSLFEFVESFFIMLFSFGCSASDAFGFAEILVHFVYLNY